MDVDHVFAAVALGVLVAGLVWDRARRRSRDHHEAARRAHRARKRAFGMYAEGDGPEMTVWR